MKFPVLIPFLLTASAFATEIPEKDWEYKRLDDDHVAVHNADQSRRSAAIDLDTEGDITVPSTLRSMQVVSIGEKAFYNCSKLTSVTIPEGVTNIAENAFYGCSSLTNIVFPASLKSIGTDAFYNCTALESVRLAVASLVIEDRAFIGCSRMHSFTISGDSVSVGEAAFAGCGQLKDVNLAAKVVSVGKGAFSYYYYSNHSPYEFSACTEITNVCILANDVSVGQSAFKDCDGLVRFDATSSKLTLGDTSFIGCESIAEFAFSGDSATIGQAVFSGCRNLKDVSLSADAVSVGESAFAYHYYNAATPYGSYYACSSLTNVVIVGTNAATIGRSAFSDCSALRRVELPIALTDVATNVFYKCTSLEDIAFSTNVTHISYRAFDTCTSLSKAVFSEGLQIIDAQAFYGCASFTDILFPQSLASIGSRAFERCDGLFDIQFAEGDTNVVAATSVTIGERAFYNCSSLTNAALSQAISSLGSRAFSQCNALASINLPTNFTDVAESVFEDCASLTTIDLPMTLKSIGNTAFYGCTSLTDFLIPTQNVVSIGAKAFKNTKYWNDYPDDLVVNNGYILGFKNNPVDVTLPDGCKAIPVEMFEGMATLKSVKIPDSVTEIGARAFNGCRSLTNLSFKSVTAIGNSAFEGCSSLVSVSISDVLTALPGNCFKNCSSLTEVFIPSNVVTIGEYAFYGCASLANVSGGSGVVSVGSYAFAQCPEMQPFEFPNDVAYADHVFQGCTWTEHVLFPSVGTLKDEYPATYASITSVVFSTTLTTITNGACAGCSSLSHVRIPDGVKTVGDLAFDGCLSLTSVVLSASVQSVATNAFRGCVGIVAATVTGGQPLRDLFPAAHATLKHVDFTDGVTSLCADFLSGCGLISTVEIPESVTSIGASAFRDCRSLSSVVLPTGITEIAAGTFSNCTRLAAIDFPTGVTTIARFAFGGCTSLASVTMAASVSEVDSTAFSGCAAIKSLVVSGRFPLSAAFPDTYATHAVVGIADDATSLCDDLFSNCVALVSVEIPWRVKSIGARTFYGCGKLLNIVVPEYVTEIGDGAFGNCKSLRSVDYLCDKPSATDVYTGTRGDMMSKVLVQLTGWQTATNSAGASILPSAWCERPIVWWGTVQPKLATVRFSNNTNRGGGTNLYYLANSGRAILEVPSLPVHPYNTNLVCTGWYTAPSGGTKIVAGWPVGATVTYYAHWVRSDGDSAGDSDGDLAADSFTVSFELPSEMTTGCVAADAKVAVSGTVSRATIKVTGLPTGLLFTAKDIFKKGSSTKVAHAANTIYGKPTKSGIYTVVASATSGKTTGRATRTVVVRKSGEYVVRADAALVDGAVRRVAGASIPGKVTGIGVYAKGRKVTLKASAYSGYVFSGWYRSDSDVLTRVSTAATYSFVQPAADVGLLAAFVSQADDKAGIGLTVNGMSFPDSDGASASAIAIETNAYVGAVVDWPLSVSALSATTVKVSGLPSGLRFAKGRISGTLTAASRVKKGVLTPSKIVVTVTTAGHNVRTFAISFTVLPLPSACIGSFSGFAFVLVNTNDMPAASDESGWVTLPCPFTATVDAKGAFSGSLTALGKRLSFRASRYAELDAVAETLTYEVSLPLKTIDRTWTLPVCLSLVVADDRLSLAAPVVGDVPFAVTEVEARRNASCDSGFAALAAPYAGTVVAAFDAVASDDATTGRVSVVMKITARGRVTAVGTFVNGKRFSASTVLFVAPDGLSATVLLPVTGQAFGSGGLLLALRLVRNDDGSVSVTLLEDDDGASVSCAAVFSPKSRKKAASYTGYIF